MKCYIKIKAPWIKNIIFSDTKIAGYETGISLEVFRKMIPLFGLK